MGVVKERETAYKNTARVGDKEGKGQKEYESTMRTDTVKGRRKMTKSESNIDKGQGEERMGKNMRL